MTCFVILHYMAADETIKCVDSILNNVEGEKKIIVVDNFSPNDSYDILLKKYHGCECVDVLKTKKNLGFAKGNNFGYYYAVKKYHPEFVTVMNNDMEIFQKDFIEHIYSSYKQYNYDILGPDVYSTKMEYHQNPQTRKILTLNELKSKYRKLVIKDRLLFLVCLKWYIKKFLKLDNDEQKERERKKKIPYVDEVKEQVLIHGSCYVFSPLFIKKHPKNCFYPKTFMYMEAEILYYLANKNGEKIIYYPHMKVYHHEDAATDATFKSYKKSTFSVKCLKQSVKAFIDLMEKDINENKIKP